MKKSISLLSKLMALSVVGCASNVHEQASEETGRTQQAAECTAEVLNPGGPTSCRGAWRFHKVECSNKETCNPGETCRCEHERAWVKEDGDFALQDGQTKFLEESWEEVSECAAAREAEMEGSCEWLVDGTGNVGGGGLVCSNRLDCVRWGRNFTWLTLPLDEQARLEAERIQKALENEEHMVLPTQGVVEYRLLDQRQINATTTTCTAQFFVPYAEALPCEQEALGSCNLQPAEYSLVGADRHSLGVPTEQELEVTYRIVPPEGGPPRALTHDERPVCTTFDQLPVDTLEQVRKKFDALVVMVKEIEAAFVRSPTERGSLLLPVLRELTTLYLVKSGALDGPRLHTITGLVWKYQAELFGETEATPVDIPTPGGSDGEDVDAGGGAANCGQNDDLIAQIVGGPLAGATDVERAVEASARLELLLRAIGKRYPENETARRAELAYRMRLIGAWWRNAPLAPGSDEPEGAGQVLKAIFDAIYGSALKTLRLAKEADRQRVYGDLLGGNLAPDRLLLELLYPENGPLPLPPKVSLRLTGTALQGLSERLKANGSARDFACRFLDCKAISPIPPVPGLWKALSAMGDRTQFGNELQRIAAHDAGAFPLVIAWGIALQRIERRYTDIAPALSDAEGQSLLGKSATAAPSYLRELAGVVQDGRAHLKWYEQSGTLAFWPANTIRHDLNDNNLRMTNLIAPGSPTDTAVSNLTMALSDYRVNEANVLGDLADELLEEDRLITVNAALTTKTEDLNAVFDALAGLRQRVAQDDARFGDFQKAWHESVKQMDLAAWQVGGQGNDGGVTSFMTDAGDAPATLDAGDFSAWGIRPAIPVKKGDFISLHVSGEWTPSCALKHEFARIMGLTGIAASVTYGETSVRRSTFGKSAIRFSRRRGARSATRLCPRSTKPYRRRSPFWWLRGTVSLRRTGPTPRAPVPGRCRWS